MSCNASVLSRKSYFYGGIKLARSSSRFANGWRHGFSASPLVSTSAPSSTGGNGGVLRSAVCTSFRFISLSELAKAFQSMDSHLHSSSTWKGMKTNKKQGGSRPTGAPPQKQTSGPTPTEASRTAPRSVSQETLPRGSNPPDSAPLLEERSIGRAESARGRHRCLLGPISESYAATLRKNYRVKRGEVGMAAVSSGKAVEALFHSELQSNLRQLHYPYMITCVLEVLTRFAKEMLHEDDAVYLNCVLSDRILELVLMCLVKLPNLYAIEAELDRWMADAEDGEEEDLEETSSGLSTSDGVSHSKLSPARLYSSLWAYYRTTVSTTSAPTLPQDSHSRCEIKSPSQTAITICTTSLSWLEQRASQFSVLMSTRVLQLLTQQPYMTSTPLLETLADNISVYCLSEASSSTDPEPLRQFDTTVNDVDKKMALWSSKWEADNREAFSRPSFYAMVLDTMLRYQEYVQHANPLSKTLKVDVANDNALFPPAPGAGEILNLENNDTLSSIEFSAILCEPQRTSSTHRYRSVVESQRERRDLLKKEKSPLDAEINTRNSAPVEEHNADDESGNNKKRSVSISPLLRPALYNGIMFQFRRHVRVHKPALSMSFRILDIPPTTFFFLLRSLAKLDVYNESTVLVLREALLPELSLYLHEHPEQYLSVLLLLGRKENAVASRDVWETILGILSRLLTSAHNRNQISPSLVQETPPFTSRESGVAGNRFVENDHMEKYDDQDNMLFSVEDILETNEQVNLSAQSNAGKQKTPQRSDTLPEKEGVNPSLPSSSIFSSSARVESLHQCHLGLLSVSLTGALLAAMPHVHRLVLPASEETSALMQEMALHTPLDLSESSWKTRLVQKLNATFLLMLNDIYHSLPSYIGAVRHRKRHNEENGTFRHRESDGEEKYGRSKESPEMEPLFIIAAGEINQRSVSCGSTRGSPSVRGGERWGDSFFFQLLRYHHLLLAPDSQAAEEEKRVCFHMVLWDNVYHCQTAALLCRSIQQLLIQVLDNGREMLSRETTLALQKLQQKKAKKAETAETASGGVVLDPYDKIIWWNHSLIVELVLLWTQLIPFLVLSRSPYIHSTKLHDRVKVYCSPGTMRQIQLLVRQLKHFGLLEATSPPEQNGKTSVTGAHHMYTVPEYLWSHSPGLSRTNGGKPSRHVGDLSFQLLSLVLSDIVQEEE